MSQPDGTNDGQWPMRRKIAAAALGVTLLAGAALVFLPIGWQINRFIVWLFYFNKGLFGFSLFTIEGYDFLLNMLLFAVPALLARLVWQQVRWWFWGLLGLLITSAIEAIQFFSLPREASLRDILANSMGAFLSALAGHIRSRDSAPKCPRASTCQYPTEPVDTGSDWSNNQPDVSSRDTRRVGVMRPLEGGVREGL